jgi:hypothetical protein
MWIDKRNTKKLNKVSATVYIKPMYSNFTPRLYLDLRGF